MHGVKGRARVGALVLGALGATLALPGIAQAAGQKWAVVDAAGTLQRGNGAVAAVKLSTGTYEVTFNSSMAGCAYVATSGQIADGSVTGPILPTVATRATNPSALFIQTFDQTTGALSDQPLHVQTSCGAKLFAVVDSAGTLARGGKVISSTHLGTGSYEVIFAKNVSKCAYTASIGTTGAGSVPAPGLITVAGRAGNKAGVFVRIVDRSGNSLDSSFHLAVSCGLKAVSAVVETNGTLVRGVNATGAIKLGGTDGGTYEVDFNRTVAGCSYTATVGTTTNGGSISTPVAITTATRAGNPNGVFLFIHQASGATIDEPFHLNVIC